MTLERKDKEQKWTGAGLSDGPLGNVWNVVTPHMHPPCVQALLHW